MKHLLLTLVFSASLAAFSQDRSDELPRTNMPVHKPQLMIRNPDGSYRFAPDKPEPDTKPDTLRAIVLVTLSPNGIAHARMGYVVICPGKRPVYLDCRKRALRWPQVGWGYEIVNPNK